MGPVESQDTNDRAKQELKFIGASYLILIFLFSKMTGFTISKTVPQTKE